MWETRFCMEPFHQFGLAETHLHALHLELHVVLPRRLAVLALLPAVAVAAVPHLLARVEQHAAALRPKERIENKRAFQHYYDYKSLRETCPGGRREPGEIHATS